MFTLIDIYSNARPVWATGFACSVDQSNLDWLLFSFILALAFDFLNLALNFYKLGLASQLPFGHTRWMKLKLDIGDIFIEEGLLYFLLSYAQLFVAHAASDRNLIFQTSRQCPRRCIPGSQLEHRDG